MRQRDFPAGRVAIVIEIGRWLEELGLGRYAPTFAANDIDDEILAQLTDADLEKLGVASLGHRKKLLAAIASRVETGTGDAAAGPEPEIPATTAQGERRHLTVMFADLVGSTALSARLDPEDLHEVIRAFQDRCANVIVRYEGYVARYMGDGILAYFGYPQAHEDDAERAVRAGQEVLEVTEGLAGSLGHDEVGDLEVRVGIATGVVVVGDLIGEGASQESPVVGETPNLAARLQALAEPGTVVISPSTRQLAGERFRYVDLGVHELRGIPNPMHAWQLAGERPSESRFDARHGTTITPLVGRDEELELLLSRWARARRGAGQVVLLWGDAGIGKSRLAQELRQKIRGEPHTWVRHQCSPFHRHSALHPIAAELEIASGFAPGDTLEGKLDKLRATVQRPDDIPDYHVVMLGEVLSLPLTKEHGLGDIPADRRKARCLETLLGHFEGLSRQAPVLWLFEDAHWIDPSSLELLEQMAERARSLPMLIVVTARPEFEPSWSGQAHTRLISLNRLLPEESIALVTSVVEHSLPAGVIENIAARTDGIPLFIEELARSTLETVPSDALCSPGKLAEHGVPETLHDSLMARLDRLNTGKELAQAGAVIGREFTRELLAALVGASEVELDIGIGELIESGLLSRRNTPFGELLTFKHALIRETAYESLLHRRRREVHTAVAELLESRFSFIAESEPELVAHHLTEAGLTERAIAWWRRAATRAAGRAAHTEAIGHLTQARDLMQVLEPGAQRADLEIAVGFALASSMRIVDRNDEGLGALALAEAAAAEQGRTVDLARIHHLRGNLHYPLGHFELVLIEHERALELAREAGAAEIEARALGGLGDANYARGRMQSAHEFFDRSVGVAQARSFEAVEVAYLPMRGMTHNFGNRLEQARQDYERAIAIGERLGELRCTMVALTGLGRVVLDQGDHNRAASLLERAVAIAERLESRRFIPAIMVTLSRMRMEQGRVEESAKMLAEADALSHATGRQFAGARVLGAVAVLTDDPHRRRAALAEAEQLLAQSSVGHNYYWFYRDAMDATLAAGDWADAERYADALERFTAEEPVAWSDFFVARTRALVAHARGPQEETPRVRLRELAAEARRVGMRSVLPAMERAMEQDAAP